MENIFQQYYGRLFFLYSSICINMENKIFTWCSPFFLILFINVFFILSFDTDTFIIIVTTTSHTYVLF
jgi:hypothetical protein